MSAKRCSFKKRSIVGENSPNPLAGFVCGCPVRVSRVFLPRSYLSPLVIGGRSMGGRAASMLAADGFEADGLLLLAYPLHPAGQPEKLRDAHLKDVKAPMLFVQGSRDAFGTKEEIRGVIKKLGLPAKLYVVEGGDHSFKVPKSAGVTPQQVHESVMKEIADWLHSCQYRER